jgi:hypothetical protein
LPDFVAVHPIVDLCSGIETLLHYLMENGLGESSDDKVKDL